MRLQILCAHLNEFFLHMHSKLYFLLFHLKRNDIYCSVALCECVYCILHIFSLFLATGFGVLLSVFGL